MTWQDISIKQYKEILDIINSGAKDDKSNLRIVSIVLKKTYDEVYGMPYAELSKELKKISFLNKNPEPRYPTNGRYTVNGKEYEMIPHASKMATGQYIDYTNTLRNDSQNIAMLCAILLVPKGGKYGEGYDPLELAEEFYNHFKMVDAMGISFFFLKVFQASQIATRESLAKLQKKLPMIKSQKKRKNIQDRIISMQLALAGISQLRKSLNIHA